jgi:hypothetical protein
VEVLKFFSAGLGVVNEGLEGAAAGLGSLQEVVTTNKDGKPNTKLGDTVTATGLLNQYRTQFALGGAGTNGTTGKCAGYSPAGDPNGSLNTNATEELVSETCAAADVLNISIKASNALEKGVSTTLLEGIGKTLLSSVGTYFKGCDVTSGLACAIGTLDDGASQIQTAVQPLPATFVKAGQGASLISVGAEELAVKADEAYDTAELTIATLSAMQDRGASDDAIPGGTPTGATSVGGVYAWFLSGAGGEGSGNATRVALALLALIGAGAAGTILARRAAG